MGQVRIEILDEVMTYHPPTEEQIPKYQRVKEAIAEAIKAVIFNCPECADRTVAIRKLREARMDANAAIALNGLI